MIRVVLFLLAVTVIASGFVWFADRPGDVAIVWMGYRIETSLMVAALAVAAIVFVAVLAWSILRAIMRSPKQASQFFRRRRAVKGYLAISRGLIAIGAGDLRGARNAAAEAARLAPGDPLALLLTAQSAQMAGDRDVAEQTFQVMSGRDDTKLLGLRGRYIEAQRRGDAQAAHQVAGEAAKAAPSLTWAGQAVLDEHCAAADWAGALQSLDHMKSALAKSEYRRKRAVLLTARAQALQEIDRDGARAAVLEAVKLAADLVPAAALAGRRLAETGEARKAGKILTAAWKANPHPDLAEAYANIRLGDSARARLTRMQNLAEKVPGQIEGALAVARAALDAREFGVARAALAPHIPAPTRRVAILMAEIEESEHGDQGRVREWMGRAMRASGDPVWTADGVVSDRWLPVSPNGRLDGYQWKLPLAEIGVSRPTIEFAPAPALETKSEVEPELPPRKSLKPPAKAKPKVADAIIPLVHAPDDPGPEHGLDGDPVPEPTSPPPRDAWARILQLFR
jgi:HemY protein